MGYIVPKRLSKIVLVLPFESKIDGSRYIGTTSQVQVIYKMEFRTTVISLPTESLECNDFFCEQHKAHLNVFDSDITHACLFAADKHKHTLSYGTPRKCMLRNKRNMSKSVKSVLCSGTACGNVTVHLHMPPDLQTMKQDSI